MSMGIPWVLLYYYVEIFYCFFVIFYHLIGLCSLVDEALVTRNTLYTSREWEDRLLKLLEAAIGKAQVVEYVSFVCHEGFISKGFL